MHKVIQPVCLHLFQIPDVTAHPDDDEDDDDALCALMRNIKVLSAGHLWPLKHHFNP